MTTDKQRIAEETAKDVARALRIKTHNLVGKQKEFDSPENSDNKRWLDSVTKYDVKLILPLILRALEHSESQVAGIDAEDAADLHRLAENALNGERGCVTQRQAKSILYLLYAAHSEQGWVSVDERLPELELGTVLVVVDGEAWKAINETHYDEEYTGTLLIANTYFVKEWAGKFITHWRPLPSPPVQPESAQDEKIPLPRYGLPLVGRNPTGEHWECSEPLLVKGKHPKGCWCLQCKKGNH